MKFNVRDENGKEYKVEEVEEVKKTDDEDRDQKAFDQHLHRRCAVSRGNRFPQETCRYGRQALRSC